MADLAKELKFIEDMEKFKAQMNPRCIVCGDLIQIVHKVQMKKKVLWLSMSTKSSKREEEKCQGKIVTKRLITQLKN